MDGRSGGGSRRGRDGRENAGMSNAKRGGIPLRRKPEVSRVKAICPGVSRPLSRRAKAVGDGKRVNIPAPPAGPMG